MWHQKPSSGHIRRMHSKLQRVDGSTSNAKKGCVLCVCRVVSASLYTEDGLCSDKEQGSAAGVFGVGDKRNVSLDLHLARFTCWKCLSEGGVVGREAREPETHSLE